MGLFFEKIYEVFERDGIWGVVAVLAITLIICSGEYRGFVCLIAVPLFMYAFVRVLFAAY